MVTERERGSDKQREGQASMSVADRLQGQRERENGRETEANRDRAGWCWPAGFYFWR